MTEPVTLRLRADNGRFIAGVRESTKEVDKLGTAVDTAGKKSKTAATNGVNILDKGVANLNSSAKDLARTLAAGLGFASVAAGITLAITKARDFNAAIGEVSTLMSDTTGLDAQAKSLRQLAVAYGGNATQQAKAYYQAISAGSEAGAEALGVLTAANKLAVGGVTDVFTSVDGLTTILNAYGDKVESAAAVSDTLFVGMKAGKTTIAELSSAIGQVAPLAETLGIEFDELVASISAVTLGGIQTSVATTQLRAALTSILKPTSEAVELSEKLGLEFNSQALAAKGLQGFLQDVVAKTKGNRDEMAKLFGSVEGLGAVFALTGGQAEAFAGILDQMESKTGATEVAFGKMSETANFAFNRGKAAAEDLLITLGDRFLVALAPLAIAFADNIEDIADALTLATKVATAYVAIFVVIPGLYNLAAAAVTRYTAAIVANNLAMELGMVKQVTGITASIKQIGLLKAAGGALFAAFAGWEIGTYLREQFVEVRIAGVYMIESLMKSWEHLKAAGKITWEAIKFAALISIDVILESMSNMLRTVAELGEVEILGKRLFGGSADDVNALADSMSNLMDPLDNYVTATAAIAVARDKEIAQIETITSDMIEWELATEQAAKAQKNAAKATKDTTTTVTAQSVAVGKALENTKEELERIAAAGQEAWASLSAHLQVVYEFQESRAKLTEGYANEIELLSRSNEEREIGRDLLRYMGENYEYLTGLSKEAAAAELKHAEAVIRTGRAGIAAKERINDLVDEFGRLENIGLFGLLDSLADVREELADIAKKELLGEAFDPKRVAELQKTITGLNAQIMGDTLGSYQALLGAAQTFTDKGSRGFELMEKGMAALSIVQDIIALKAAVSAVLTQGQGDPYSAWARMAAMAAAVAPFLASIGQTLSSFGGGGGGPTVSERRQESQGRGTVLGDAEAQSESILNAVEITASASQELVGINRGMLNALNAMQAGIGNAAGSLARAGFADLDLSEAFGNSIPGVLGNILGSIFGGDQDLVDQGIIIRGGNFGNVSSNPNASSYQTIETDGGWFRSDRINDELEALSQSANTQIRLILESLGNAVREGALALGLSAEEINRAIDAFRIEEIRISTMDLTGEEAQKELEAAFSRIFDNLAGAVVPFIDQFQRVGEGLGETLIRVATSVQVMQEAVIQLGLGLETMDPERMAQISVALVDAAGGVEAFISGMQSFVANFASEEHRFMIAQDELLRAFAQAGLTLPDTREGMWDLMQSLDATTESGRQQIATLLRLADVADSYYNMLEQRAEDQADAAREAREAVLEELSRIAAMRAEAMGVYTTATSTYGAPRTARQTGQDTINRAFDQYIEKLTELGDPLNQIIELEGLRVDALERANAAIDAQINRTLDDIAFELNVDGLDEAERALAQINLRFNDYREQLVAQGATTEQLTRLEELRTEALDQATQAAEDAAYATQQLAMNWINFTDQTLVIIDSLRSSVQHLLNPQFVRWINDLTNLSMPSDAVLVSRTDALQMIGTEYSTRINEINQAILQAQADLSEMGGLGDQSARQALQNRIQQLQSLLAEVTGTMGDAIEYANELFTYQISNLLGTLRQEFGSNNPIDAINDRFDKLIEQATAWGASMEELAEIELYRIQAIEQAQEEAFQKQMDWIRSLRELSDSLLLDDALTTLTPAEQMEEARRQYESTLAAAMAGDENAQQNFESIAREYLDQLRSFYGSTDEYTMGFQGVLADIESLIAASGGDTEALVSALLGNNTVTDDEAEAVSTAVAPVVEELINLRQDTQEGFMAVVASLSSAGEKLDTVIIEQQNTVAELRALRDSGLVRTN